MSGIKSGFSRLCITPPLGIELSGYYEKRYAKGILDDLYVSAIAFDDGEKKAVVLAVDNIGLATEDCDKYRKMISEFCDVSTDAISISCSHIHTGPAVGIECASGNQGMPIYDEYLGIQMRDAVKLAFEDACDSKIYTAEGIAKNISFIRRFKMKDGSVRTNPGDGNPNIDHPLGEPNETVKLLKIVREDAEDIFVVNFGTHPDVIGGELISADFPGFVCSTIESAIPDTYCMFLQAPQGDVNHCNPLRSPDEPGTVRGYEHSRHMGRVIAGAVLQICDKAVEVKADKIEYAAKTIVCPTNKENDRLDEARKIVEIHNSGRDEELLRKGMGLSVVAEAARIVSLENAPETFEFDVTAVKIGNLTIVGIPGEAFTEVGNRIYKESPFDTTILCCLTNGGGDIYIPNSLAYEEGGYESQSSTLKKGADDIVVNGTIELLKSMQ